MTFSSGCFKCSDVLLLCNMQLTFKSSALFLLVILVAAILVVITIYVLYHSVVVCGLS